MRLDIQELPATFWVPALLIYLGSMFQVGYFQSFGLEFLTTVGAGDWLFALLVMAIPLATFGIVVIWAAQIGAKLLMWFVGWTSSDRGKSVLSLFPGWAWLLIYIYLVAVLRHHVPKAGPYVEFLVLIIVLGQTALFLTSLEQGDDWTTGDVKWLWLSWTIVAFTIGQYYGVAGGRVCTVTFKDGRQLSAVYMRSVSNGHLIRVANSSYYLDNSNVDELRCAWSDNSWNARMKIAFPGLKS